MGSRKLDIETRLSQSGTCLGGPSARGAGRLAVGTECESPRDVTNKCPGHDRVMVFSYQMRIAFVSILGQILLKKKKLKPQQLNPIENPVVPISLWYCMQIRAEV